MLGFKQFLESEDRKYYYDYGHDEESYLWTYKGGKIIISGLDTGHLHGDYNNNNYWRGRYIEHINTVTVVGPLDELTIDYKAKLPIKIRMLLHKQWPTALLKGFHGVKV